MRILRAFLGVCLLFGLSASAASQDPNDDRINDQVRLKLAGDPDVKGGAIAVDVQRGVVTLKGTVKEDRYKNKAERLARKVKGVKKVVNDLQIETPEQAARPKQ